jgi:hypothetical protein
MSSYVPEYRPRFADSLTKGSVFSVHRDGSAPVRVTSQPEKIKNMIGERTHVVMWVRPYIPGDETPVDDGRMIFAPSNVVYVQQQTKEI